MLQLSKLRTASPHSSSPRKTSRKTSLSFGLAVALATLCASWPGVAAGPDQTTEKKLSPVVQTKEGPVQGFISNGVAEFLGVPYAEPPVGNLRWKPPKNHAPWAGVLKTQAYAPICAQITTLGVFAGPANNNEDCLYLNVFTPNLDPSAQASGDRLDPRRRQCRRRDARLRRQQDGVATARPSSSPSSTA